MKNQFNNFVCNNRLINQVLPQGEGADFWQNTLRDRPTAGGSSSQGETSDKKGMGIIEQAQKQLAKIDKPEDKVHNIEARVTRAFLKVAALTEQLQKTERNTRASIGESEKARTASVSQTALEQNLAAAEIETAQAEDIASKMRQLTAEAEAEQEHALAELEIILAETPHMESEIDRVKDSVAKAAQTAEEALRESDYLMQSIHRNATTLASLDQRGGTAIETPPQGKDIVSLSPEELQLLLHPQPKPQEEEPMPTQELLAANLARAEKAERIAKLEKRQLTPAQKLAKTRKFIEGKTDKDAELIKQRFDVDLATAKPEEAEAAVKKLQAVLGMSEKDQDGILGKKTFNKLAALAALETPKQKPAESAIRDLAINLSRRINTIGKNYNIAKTINAQQHKPADNIIKLNTAMQTVSDELKIVDGLAANWISTYELPPDFSVKMIGLSPVALNTDMKQFDVVQAFGGTNGMLQYAEMSREWESQLAAAKKSYRTVIDSVAKGFVTPTGVIQEPELQARLDELAPENGRISPIILAAGKDNEQFRKDVQAKTKNISIAILKPALQPAAEATATGSSGLDETK